MVQDGKVVGVAFQGYPGAENMGFFIPIPIVRHFLDNLKDGRYDGFPDSGLDTMPLLSPALRRERALPSARSGVVVERIAPGGTFDGVLRPGDVLLSIQGQTIANDGTIRLGEARVTFEHAVDMLQVGQPARLTVWRDGSGAAARGDRPPHRALRPPAQPLRRRARLRRLRRPRVHGPRVSSC